ncbi:MAG TPA: hypothetical protein VNJ10_06265 [Sphingomonas sp.]|nr:hypothetical protein [Sphingomonas sp.]
MPIVTAMHPMLALPLLILTTPVHAAEDPARDPTDISEVDAIECRLDVPSYNGFAFAIQGEERIAATRHWKKIESKNPFMNEYELPAPITVAGTYSTRRLGMTASGIVAILDLPDPAVLARREGIANALDATPFVESVVASGKASRAEAEGSVAFRKFLGEKLISDTVERPAEGQMFGAHFRITRNVSNISSHPGKTLYGCNYALEVIGKDGEPL